MSKAALPVASVAAVARRQSQGLMHDLGGRQGAGRKTEVLRSWHSITAMQQLYNEQWTISSTIKAHLPVVDVN